MIRLINCIKRRNDISDSQFREYWNSFEFDLLIGKIVKKSGATRYKKSATLIVEANDILRQLRGSNDPFDGILEYWWENAKHLEDAYESG